MGKYVVLPIALPSDEFRTNPADVSTGTRWSQLRTENGSSVTSTIWILIVLFSSQYSCRPDLWIPLGHLVFVGAQLDTQDLLEKSVLLQSFSDSPADLSDPLWVLGHRKTKEARPEKLHRPDSAGPGPDPDSDHEPEPGCVSIKSDWSNDHIIDFKGQQPMAANR
ncbi:hypothetical protein Q8A73_004075 [Channa argus]|nr:hypothetical protein Q8A73_004075 [Channa argus]